jgi:hypothetical protein
MTQQQATHHMTHKQPNPLQFLLSPSLPCFILLNASLMRLITVHLTAFTPMTHNNKTVPAQPASVGRLTLALPWLIL